MRVLLIALLFSLCAIVTAQPSFTDSTFGTNGKIVKNTSIPYKYIIDMVLQADGKAVLLADAYYDHVDRIVLVRYNTNGTPDNTFSGNGIADSLFKQDVDYQPTAIKLQPDGKILVCGTSSDFPNNAFVARYLTNGSLDVSFGYGGIFYEPVFIVNNNTSTVPTINNVAVLPGGKLMLLSSVSGDNVDLLLTRLNPNGRVDSTYGTNGIVALDASESFVPEWRRIEVQTNGRLLVGGDPNRYDQSAGTAFNAAVLRINTNGTIDSTYGTNGKVALHVGTAPYDRLKDMALQSDGKVVLSGMGTDFNNNYRYTFVTRLNSNGVPDGSFGTAGGSLVLAPANGIFYSDESQMSLQADGKIILAGCSRNATGNYDMALARLTTAGQPDAGFDGDGFTTLVVNSYASFAIVAQQQVDGKLVLGGLARSGNAASTTIARPTATGQPDATLDAVAAITYIGSGTDGESGVSLQIQPDGKILSINGRYAGAGYDIGITRYTATGAPDNTYGTGGTRLLEITSGYNDFFSGLLSNGKLMLGTGYGDYFTGGGVFITRINTNGTTDSSFGTAGKFFLKTRSSSFINVVPQVAFQPDGKTVLLYAQLLSDDPNAEDSTFLVRLNVDGSFDNTFNGNGRKYLPDSLYSQFNRLSLQPDGKILVSELRYSGAPNGGNYTAVRRIAANGNTDNTFNNGNVASFPFKASSMLVQADGKVVVAGGQDMFARLNGNGVPDAGFGTTGLADVSAAFPEFYSPVSMKEIDSNRLVAVGLAYDTTTYDNFVQIIALRKNGTADTSFGNGGKIDVAAVSGLENGAPLAVQADKKILLTGYFEPSGAYAPDAVLTRLKSSGLTGGRLYTFTGSGLWSSPANWSDGTVPPTTITAGNSLVIDPIAGGECVIDITVHVQAGATVTVKAGKRLRLPGNLIIQ